MENKFALTIAGSDSGGGAGIQADLKTFTHFNVYGTSVITCLTAQNPDIVNGIQEVSLELIENQLKSIFDYFPITTVKTGMLFSQEIVDCVASFLKDKKVKLVIDPVMVATSGAKLLKNGTINALKNKLIPLACLYTPNRHEAEILLDKTIQHENEMEDSAKELYKLFSVPVLLKGGHFNDSSNATDIYYDGKKIISFPESFIKGVNTHGTGCTYSAAITANLAKGHSIIKSIEYSKKYLHQTIVQSINFNKSKSALNHTPNLS